MPSRRKRKGLEYSRDDAAARFDTRANTESAVGIDPARSGTCESTDLLILECWFAGVVFCAPGLPPQQLQASLIHPALPWR